MAKINVGPYVVQPNHNQDFEFKAEEHVAWVSFDFDKDYTREQLELEGAFIDGEEARGGMVLRPGQTGSVRVGNISDADLEITVTFTLDAITDTEGEELSEGDTEPPEDSEKDKAAEAAPDAPPPNTASAEPPAIGESPTPTENS